MSSLACYIVKDLLPLYIDQTCCKETQNDVREHLETCASCRKLYEDMTSDFSTAITVPKLEEKKMFRHVQKNLLAMMGALLVSIICILLNFSSAWEGGPGNVGNLVVTGGYILFWSAFLYFTRKYAPLVRFSLIVSSVTMLLSLLAFLSVWMDRGGFFTALLALPVGVQFGGLRYFMEWPGVYGIALAVSFLWTIFSGGAWYRIHGKFSEKEKKPMKNRLILTGCFLISLVPMLLSQYGGRRSVQEITGLINLTNPIGILSLSFFLIGVWGTFRKRSISRIFGYAGTIGMVMSEIFEFLTWHIQTITGEFSLRTSVHMAFPEFYIGLVISLGMIAVYGILERRMEK